MPKFTVQKSVIIDAPLNKIYASVRNFKQWPIWSPWLITEPDCDLVYAADGKSYSWKGKVVGVGEMIIAEEQPEQSIRYQLNFLKPWKSTSKVEFAFASKEGGVEVTWTMRGALPFFMFWMKPMMVAWVGMDYQRGLLMLKDYLESDKSCWHLDFIGKTAFAGFDFVGVKNECKIADVGPQMEKDFSELNHWREEASVAVSGAPFSIYHKWDMVKGLTEYTLGFPVEDLPSSLPPSFVSGSIPRCETYTIKHTGPYRHLGNAWSAGMMRGQSKVFRQNKKIHPFEVYENDPRETDENALETTVHFPLK